MVIRTMPRLGLGPEAAAFGSSVLDTMISGTL